MKNDALTILLVDDDDVDVMSVKRAFRRLNISNPLHVAKNGLEALAMLRGEGRPKLPKPSIILLDLNMPKMGGHEFLKEIRSDPELSTITVIVLTTSNDEGDKLRAYESHVAGYLVKPVVGADFVETMASFNKYWTMSELPPAKKSD